MPDEQRLTATNDGSDDASGTLAVYVWRDELGLAQAMWVIRANRMGPFIVASDRTGACLFERENAKIAANLEKVYEGTKPAVLKRLGETDDRSDEMIG